MRYSKSKSKSIKSKQSGKGFIEDIQKYPVSTIASYTLPAILGSVAGTAGGEIGLLAGPVGAAIGATAGSALGSFTGKKIAEDWRRKGYGYSNKRSMLGGGSMNPDLSGFTKSYNGTYQPIAPRMISGKGQTSPYGTISSEFGKILV